MTSDDIIRFWKTDEEDELMNDVENVQLPPGPIGPINLHDDELREVVGGGGSIGGGVFTSGTSKMEDFSS